MAAEKYVRKSFSFILAHKRENKVTKTFIYLVRRLRSKRKRFCLFKHPIFWALRWFSANKTRTNENRHWRNAKNPVREVFMRHDADRLIEMYAKIALLLTCWSRRDGWFPAEYFFRFWHALFASSWWHRLLTEFWSHNVTIFHFCPCWRWQRDQMCQFLEFWEGNFKSTR
jgi:hypothetical protein